LSAFISASISSASLLLSASKLFYISTSFLFNPLLKSESCLYFLLFSELIPFSSFSDKFGIIPLPTFPVFALSTIFLNL